MDIANGRPRGSPIPTYNFVLQPFVSYKNQPQALVVSKGYHMVFAINIQVNRWFNPLKRIKIG